MKLAMISTITSPIGNAAMMDTVCRLLMLPSEKISAIGRRISRIAQKNYMRGEASSSPRSSL